MSEELKPCPFCGSRGIHDIGGVIICENVDCCAFGIDASEEKWNTRLEEERLQKHIDEFEAENKRIREALEYAVKMYGKPGGPWNVPGEPGTWIAMAKKALKGIEK